MRSLPLLNKERERFTRISKQKILCEGHCRTKKAAGDVRKGLNVIFSVGSQCFLKTPAVDKKKQAGLRKEITCALAKRTLDRQGKGPVSKADAERQKDSGASPKILIIGL